MQLQLDGIQAGSAGESNTRLSIRHDGTMRNHWCCRHQHLLQIQGAALLSMKPRSRPLGLPGEHLYNKYK